MSFPIQRVAVLGAGVMGAGIAAHLANAGVESLLFDIVPKDAGADVASRTAFAIKGVQSARTIKPAALFRPDAAALITPCNYEDHADRLQECDWIVEVVAERLDIKQKVYAWVAEHGRADAIVTSNTSGIPLRALTEAMSPALRSRFLITHFFNPVRYMRLLELVTGPDTDPAVTATIAAFGERVLGKGIVYGKDTPNFVGNRIGTYGMASVFHHMQEKGFSIEAVDAIFGAPLARPKSAVFNTADIVGIDTLVHVFGNVVTNAPDDEERARFEPPAFVTSLVASGRVGRKANAGFYKKVGKDILVLDVGTGEYRPQEKVRYDCIGKARQADDAAGKLKAMVYGTDPAAELAWAVTADTLLYSARRIPEIADDIVQVDRAMRWGFSWDLGPFETWDAIGVRTATEKMLAEGREIPGWVTEMLGSGRESFYARDAEGTETFWQVKGGAAPVPRGANHTLVSDLKAKGAEKKRNTSSSLLDLGEGVALLEFHSKMNSLDELIFDQLEGALDALDAGDWTALVIGNQDGRAFCAGANVLMILMGAMQGEWKAMEQSMLRLQTLMMRAKYHKKPVVTAPYGLTLGGGAETAMHSAATVAAGELYMGLVEVGVGLIPGAGGCKEVIVRSLGDVPQDVDYDPNPFIQKAFERIGLAKVSSSAEEARSWGYLRPTDRVVLDPDALIFEARRTALGLVASGYEPPRPRTVKLPGRGGRAAIEAYLSQMRDGGFATPHDVVVGTRLAHVLCGGDIPAGTVRTEDQLLGLEREAFLHLAGTPATQARIQHMLQTGKPLRN